MTLAAELEAVPPYALLTGKLKCVRNCHSWLYMKRSVAVQPHYRVAGQCVERQQTLISRASVHAPREGRAHIAWCA